jgi:hypothetical protein
VEPAAGKIRAMFPKPRCGTSSAGRTATMMPHFVVSEDEDEDEDDSGDKEEAMHASVRRCDCLLAGCERAFFCSDVPDATALAALQVAREEMLRAECAFTYCTGLPVPSPRCVATLHPHCAPHTADCDASVTPRVPLIFSGGVLTFGSDANCDSGMPGLEPVHACLFSSDGSVFARNLGGQVCVGGRRVDGPVVVKDGDVFALCAARAGADGGAGACGSGAGAASALEGAGCCDGCCDAVWRAVWVCTVRLSDPSCTHGTLRRPPVQYLGEAAAGRHTWPKHGGRFRRKKAAQKAGEWEASVHRARTSAVAKRTGRAPGPGLHDGTGLRKHRSCVREPRGGTHENAPSGEPMVGQVEARSEGGGVGRATRGTAPPTRAAKRRFSFVMSGSVAPAPALARAPAPALARAPAPALARAGLCGSVALAPAPALARAGLACERQAAATCLDDAPRKAGRIQSRSRRASCEAAGTDGTAAGGTGQRWDDMLARLSAFQLEHGHCRVRRRAHDVRMRMLAEWVHRQRHLYRHVRSAAQLAAVDASRVQRLDAIGFTWFPALARPPPAPRLPLPLACTAGGL